MKRIIRSAILITSVIVTVSCSSSKKHRDSNLSVVPLSENSTLTEGSIVYALPRTVFTVYINMDRIIEKPGPYSRYASDMLGLSNVIMNEKESWSIVKVTVKAHEEVDPSEYYVVKSNSLFQTNVLSLKKEGLVMDINPGDYYSSESNSGVMETDKDQMRSVDLGSDEYFKLQSDTAYKRVSIDSSFVRIPYIVEKKKLLTVDQLAEKAARRIMEMRDGKHLILTGEANVFPQSDAAIIEMNRLEKEYTELFTGKTLRERRTFTYQIIPDKHMIGKPVTLCQFSEQTGPGTGTLKGGEPVTADLIPEQKTKNLIYTRNNQNEKSASVYDKLYYRAPDVVNLKISKGTDILLNTRKLIYQFGEVIQLPSNYVFYSK